MPSSSNNKNKVDLSDYNYQGDIANRLFLAKLSATDVSVLQEILNGSLKIGISQLVNSLNIKREKLLEILKELSCSKLFQIKEDTIFVDKEIRKYFDSQIIKFEDDFEAGMDFLQSLLNKVPIHALPNWYSISRINGQIFESIIEKYLITPKIYERYLNDFQFDDPVAKQIYMDLFACPELKLRAKEFIERYHLMPEEFEKHMLYLEYNFICCLRYERFDDHWEEIITPFAEWHKYQSFLKKSIPKAISDPENIKRKHPHDFGFARDLSLLLKEIQKCPLKLAKGSEALSVKESLSFLPHLEEVDSPQAYLTQLCQTAAQLQLTNLNETELKATDRTQQWLNKNLTDSATDLYRHFITFIPEKSPWLPLSDRDVREIERNLRRSLSHHWIYFDDLIASFTAPIGNQEPVSLKNKGRKWKYALPTYGKAEKATLQNFLCDVFFFSGMAAVGTHRGKLCLSITPFGRMTLGG